MTRRSHSVQRTQQGLSLLELMIAMAIGLVLVATIGYAYVGAKQSFRTQGALSRIQESARFAFEIMGMDIRMAGFTGGTGVYANITAQPGGWTGTTQDLREFPLRGYDAGATPAWVAPVAGDAITIVHANNEIPYPLANVAGNCSGTTPCTLTTWPADAPAVADTFVVADYTHAAAFQASAVNAGALTITSATDLGVFTGDVGARKLYPLSGVTYFIANNPAGEPSLYRFRQDTGNSEELVEGVSDMQITYGVDTSAPADRNIDEYWATAAEVTAGTGASGTVLPIDIPANPAIGYWQRVLSVRITLTMASRTNESVATGGGALRKTLTNTLAIRNRL